ncbi:response regulator transcription factor [Actinomycetospora chlora]|uniref:Response regulator transcription factor n=1 Tax=Actinomycetospora chlora TaxID=663608 RepID=A0ABP9A7E1_9PSEU
MTDSRRPAEPTGRRGAGSRPGDDAVRPVTVVIIDGHEMVRAGLRMMVADRPEVRVVGEAEDARTGVAVAMDLAPDVVLVETRLRDADGLDVCRDLVARGPAQVVVFAAHDDEASVTRVLDAGARGYLLKQVSAGELVDALLRVRAGDLVVDPRAAGRGQEETTTGVGPADHRSGGHLGLTPRESDVLALIVTGMTNSAISARLVVGEQTVKTHVRAIYRKLGVNDRESALARALREGLFH